MIRIALCLLAASLAGCGYSTGLRAAERTGSVAVLFFENDTYERDIERSLQDEMTRALRSLTDLRLADPSTADVLVRGKVIDFRRRDGIRSEDNELLETGVYVEAEAILIDRRNDRALGPPSRALAGVGYVLDDPSNEVEARQRVLRTVAEQLVLDLFAPAE